MTSNPFSAGMDDTMCYNPIKIFLKNSFYIRGRGCLCAKDPLEEGMAPHSSILAWRIPWTEEPGGLQSIGSHRMDMTEAT